jgi:ADP-ribosylglycohydrolase
VAPWGHLVGDAVGVPYELLRAARSGGVHWDGTRPEPPGVWSDDGVLTLMLLDSQRADGVSLDNGSRAFAWCRGGASGPDDTVGIGWNMFRAMQVMETLPRQADNSVPVGRSSAGGTNLHGNR